MGCDISKETGRPLRILQEEALILSVVKVGAQTLQQWASKQNNLNSRTIQRAGKHSGRGNDHLGEKNRTGEKGDHAWYWQQPS